MPDAIKNLDQLSCFQTDVSEAAFFSKLILVPTARLPPTPVQNFKATCLPRAMLHLRVAPGCELTGAVICSLVRNTV